MESGSSLQPALPNGELLKAISYESTIAAEPPIPITNATASSHTGETPSNGHVAQATDPEEPSIQSKPEPNADKKSASIPTSPTSAMTESGASPSARGMDSVNPGSSLPQIRVHQDVVQHKKRDRLWSRKKSTDEPPKVNGAFHGIDMDIPTGDLEGFNTDSLQFSKRGSMLMAGMKTSQTPNSHLRPVASTRRVKSNPSMRRKPTQKALSVDEEVLSQKVRSFYEIGSDAPTEWDDHSSTSQQNGTIWGDSTVAQEGTSARSVSRNTSNTDLRSTSSLNGSEFRRASNAVIKREEMELAGGLEDWQDVQNGQVDRYGFIIARAPSIQDVPKAGIQRSPSSVDPQTLQRVTTSLQIAAETPRRKRTVKRAASNANSTRSSKQGTPTKQASGSPARPSSSQSSYQSSPSGSHSILRTATNKLPHNRDRRLRDEAADMLTLPPTLADIAEDGVSDLRDDPQMKRKEWVREEKWKKMARVVSKDNHGGGMTFEFDTHSPKVVERTWKGIPDSWRATAWHAFLTASAKKRKTCASDEELIQAFADHQDQSSPEDVQIDIDVPRTISSHIMFRRRYRGGQRLLFRVLHAMSLHFPETGYVQGMATIAATLLAYYDEEIAFVMLVRLWELRGLEQLYRSGFAGLMEALDNFEKGWLKNGQVAVKLNDLGIPPTSYGTRWYLTLFNYSIPFSAQLRVWDVFMLLGDSDGTSTVPNDSEFGTSLDPLHAASAALIAGTKDILLESDFENGMKVLTSWIPIRDEELFMKVAKAEYKVHKRRV